MRRARAPTGPPRGLRNGRPIANSTALLCLAAPRPAAAPPCCHPAPCLGLAQSRFLSKGAPSRSPDSWSSLVEEASRQQRPESNGRWSRSGRLQFETEAEDLRVEEKFFDKKPPPGAKSFVEGYLFSDLVLGLGAEDAPGVRDYSKADKDHWRKKWNAPSEADVAARDRLAEHVRVANSAESTYRYIRGVPLRSHDYIRESDILSVALRGCPKSGTPSVQPATEPPPPVYEAPWDMTRVLHLNGIPGPARADDAALLWWMGARETQEVPQPAVLGKVNDERFHLSSHGSRFNFREFRRLVSAYVASGKKISGCSREMEMRVYELCIRDDDKPPELNSCHGVLALIMDLEEIITRDPDRHLGASLCRVALENAMGGLYIPAAHHYLDQLQRCISGTVGAEKRLVAPAVGGALERLKLALTTARPGARLPSRSDVLRLLVGVGPFSPEGEKLSPSVGQLLAFRSVRNQSLPLFIEILAGLGALRTLWQFWRHHSRMRNGQTEDEGFSRVDVVTRALVDARHAILRYDFKTQYSEDPVHAVTTDCYSMPRRITTPRWPSPDAAPVEIPRELPFQITVALDMDSMNESVQQIQHLIREFSKTIDGDERPADEPVQKGVKEEAEVPNGLSASEQSWAALQGVANNRV